MRQLRLVAVSDDGMQLILSDGDEQLALQVDERLHAAIRGDRARLGQLEIQLESQLRPRDIQARIRAGESVEAVAAVAGMPLDKVRRFAGPVIAEREHIADRARQATMRRVNGDGPVRTLDAAATAAAGAHGVDADGIEWDAWRRDDGRWQVRCAWPAGDSEAAALFSFDPSGRSVVPDDDPARILAGEMRRPEPEPAAPAGPARLSVVGRDDPATEPAPDDEDDELVSPAPPAARTEPLPPIVAAAPPVHELTRTDDTATHDAEASTDVAADDDQATAPMPAARRGRRPGRPERRRRDPDLWAEDDDATSERLRLSDIASRVEVEGAPAPVTPAAPTPAPAPEPAAPEAPAAETEPPVADSPAAAAAAAADSTEPRPARKAASGSRSRRPSVPSWDEIMFGRPKE